MDRLWSSPCTEPESDPFLFARGANQMRIGIVTEYYYPTLGGIQEHVHHFARAARRVGHDVRILTPEVRDSLGRPRRAGSRAAARPARGRRKRRHPRRRVGAAPLGRARSRGRRPGSGLAARVREILRARSSTCCTCTRRSCRRCRCSRCALRRRQRRDVPQRVGRSLSSALLAAVHPALRRSASTRRSASRRRRSTGSAATFRAPWHVMPNGVDVAMFASGRRRPEFDDGRRTSCTWGGSIRATASTA